MRQPRQRVSEARQRAENAGYSDAEIDAALLQHERSDWPSVLLRVAVVALVYGLLARSVADGLSSPFLLLPLMLELLVIFWLGWLLSRSVVSCKSFRRSAGPLLLTVFWTLVAIAVVMAALAFDGGQRTFDPARIAPAGAAAWQTMLDHELHWAMLAMLAGLLCSTALDVTHWRSRGGVFFWASITSASFRLGLVIVIVLFAGVPLLLFGDLTTAVARQLAGIRVLSDQLYAWPVWAALLLLDVGVIAIAALMHRDLQQKAGTPKPPGKR